MIKVGLSLRIAFFEVKDWEEEYLKRQLNENLLEFSSEKLNPENLDQIKDLEAISVFIYSRIDEQVLTKLPNLKLITTRSTGFDHIDIEICKKMGITVCNVPSYGESTVAEHTFALILSISRHLCATCPRLGHNFSMESLMGFDLKGKTMGVIGAGQIGLHVIRIAKGFGMNVLAYDTRPSKILSEVLGFEYASLNELLSGSDVITLHVPYNDHTHHLMDRDKFKIVKKGAILINTARGSIVDTEALIEALENKVLSGAGLDVIEGEELIKEEKQLLYDSKNIEVLANLIKDHILQAKTTLFLRHT
jgi:D-lactate dehydrogenase